MDAAFLHSDCGPLIRRSAYQQLDRADHGHGHDNPNDSAHRGLLGRIFGSDLWSRQIASGSMDARTHLGSAGIAELERGAAATRSRRRRSWIAEGSHERFGTVTLDTRDSCGHIRDATLEVLPESLRLCVAHLDLPHIAALATAQANRPTRHRRSPAQLHRRHALLVPGDGIHEVGVAATAVDQSAGRRGETATRTIETPEELDESHELRVH